MFVAYGSVCHGVCGRVPKAPFSRSHVLYVAEHNVDSLALSLSRTILVLGSVETDAIIATEQRHACVYMVDGMDRLPKEVHFFFQEIEQGALRI